MFLFAQVLNSDGSLPMDGSGDFELVSKRGPPRGPRGPRKELLPGPAPVTLPHMGGLSSPTRSLTNGIPSSQMNGMIPGLHPNLAAVNMAAMAGATMWPMMPGLNGLPGPPALLQMNPSLHPMNMQQVAPEQTLANGIKTEDPSSDEGAHIKEEPRTINAKTDGTNDEIQMNDQLLQMMKLQQQNHQDLFRMFGLRPETLMEEQLNTMKLLAERDRELMLKLSRDEDQNPLAPQLQTKAMPQLTVKPETDVKKDPASLAGDVQSTSQFDTSLKAVADDSEDSGNPTWTSQASNEKEDEDQQETGVSSSTQLSKERYNKVVAAGLAAQIQAEAQTNGECPLDLTKASSNEDDSGIVHSTDGVLDYSPSLMQRKRHMDSDASNGNNTTPT